MTVDAKQAIGLLIGVVAIMVVALVGITIMDGVVAVGPGGQTTSQSSSPLIAVDSPASFADTDLFAGEVESVNRVRDSTGRALLLRGASDSTYQTSTQLTIANDKTWTVSVHAEYNNSYGTTNGTVVSLDGRVLLQYDNATQEWIGWYYDEGSRYSHRVSVAAPDQPGSLATVQLVSNGTHLAIYNNNTRGGVANLGVERYDDPLLNASNWAGRQDELRGYDAALSASDRQQLIDSPVQPLNGEQRRYRVMFDEGSGTSEPVYFTSAKLSLSNTTYMPGLAGNTLTEGVDYSVNTEDGEITALDGGRLDTAPTVFVDYSYTPNKAASDLGNSIAGSFELFAIVPVAFVAFILFGALGSLRE